MGNNNGGFLTRSGFSTEFALVKVWQRSGKGLLVLARLSQYYHICLSLRRVYYKKVDMY